MTNKLNLNELQQYIDEGKKAINKILNWLEQSNFNVPFKLDLESTREMFIFMQGYATCLEKLTTA